MVSNYITFVSLNLIWYKKNKFYTFNVLCSAVFSPGLVMVVQYFMGENKTWAVVCFTLALTLNGAVTAGYLGNGLDIAPNFSGTIFGLANTLSSSGGFISTYMVAAITYGAEVI